MVFLLPNLSRKMLTSHPFIPISRMKSLPHRTPSPHMALQALRELLPTALAEGDPLGPRDFSPYSKRTHSFSPCSKIRSYGLSHREHFMTNLVPLSPNLMAGAFSEKRAQGIEEEDPRVTNLRKNTFAHGSCFTLGTEWTSFHKR